MYGQNTPQVRLQVSAQSHGFPQTPSPTIHNTTANLNMNALAQAFGGFGLHGSPSINAMNLGTPTLSTASTDTSSLGIVQPLGAAYMLPSGELVLPDAHRIQSSGQAQTAMHQATGSHYPFIPQYLSPVNYQGYAPGQHLLPATPQNPGWSRSQLENAGRDIPGLVNRRDSWSSNEENAPGTPYYGEGGHSDLHQSVLIADRSPIDAYGYARPSPQELSQTYGHQRSSKAPAEQFGYHHLDVLLQQDPSIPHAVPAIFSRPGSRTLAKALENEGGQTNVYIRGLLADTTDALLEAYVCRFGPVHSSKAIVNLQDGRCKGYGFAKYLNYADAETCIRGFFRLGYEVSFAKDSFNTRLKTLADQDATNLYVSNLPRRMNEAELGAIFIDYKVLSSRILRETDTGISRGVGFARLVTFRILRTPASNRAHFSFETRAICDEVIAKFHGQPIGEESLQLQVRYADNDEQKLLKHDARTRRNFKAMEYDLANGGFGFYPSPVQRVGIIAGHIGSNALANATGAAVKNQTLVGNTNVVNFQNDDFAHNEADLGTSQAK
ncbi:MAG: hypothetical protein M1827_002380 [Pycnora praestabilis]|nr:MAG: hypothetical protein M1827_002380 [Pycnora praestabilis]